ncbi:MAG: haloacid dehalogenase-like hydrolase [Lachnospiraceae bacterium]|nr:haloacid dehalogenase-like hydrolase [Lachnospiraceae bacterium]
MEKVWNALQEKNRILVCDFDGTLTVSGSSMHGIVRVLGEAAPITKARDSLYMQYGKMLKTEENISVKKQLAMKWWQAQMDLFIQYNIQENLFRKVAKQLTPRDEAVDLLEKCREAMIPVWIVSAGVANVIEAWLEQQGLSGSGIYILANRVCYEDGMAVGCSDLVTPWNKAEMFFKSIETDSDFTLVFLGDQKEDVGWKGKNTNSFLVNGQSVEMTFI